MALKGPALQIWAQCLKDVADGLAADDLSNFATLAERMRLNALSAYQKEFGEQKDVRGETLGLIKALTLSSEESLSVINTELKFVYMNQRFRQFFDMPEDVLSVGDPAHKFYRRIANNPAFGIENTERYVFLRVNELRNIKDKRSVIRETGKGHFFRITQTRLEDGSILTNTERLSDAKAARLEMQQSQKAQAKRRNEIDDFRKAVERDLSGPLKDLALAADALGNTAKSNLTKEKLGEMKAAISTCLLQIEKSRSAL